MEWSEQRSIRLLLGRRVRKLLLGRYVRALGCSRPRSKKACSTSGAPGDRQRLGLARVGVEADPRTSCSVGTGRATAVVVTLATVATVVIDAAVLLLFLEAAAVAAGVAVT